MKKLLAMLMGTVMLIFLLVACDGGADDTPVETQHQHSFGTEWSFDATSHWYQSTCGHDFKANLADHVDENKDGTCDICLYDGDHEHVFAEEWSHDEAQHWHAATCNHAVKADEAAHADANNDGICDGCGWNYDHEHTYAAEWSHNGEYHWYDITCGHNGGGKDKAAHADANNDGICDGCAWDYDHTHTYADEWSHDKDKHWHATTCGHDLTADEADHVDDNNDGICDGCAWDYDHTHTYATGDNWSINSTHHWHGATCGHKVAGVDQEAHVDGDENRYCDICGYDYDHEHTYKEEWSWDKQTHYHESTCGHDVVSEEGAHVDVNNDGICDTCGWNYDHEHTYSTEWSHDSQNHWHGPTCGHNPDLLQAEKGAHEDVNNDSVCDVCAWDYGHTHTFDTSKWTVSGDSHYHAPTCGHNPIYVRGDEEKHTDGNFDNRCDTCGGWASMEYVVENATSTQAAGKVNGGSIIYDKKTDTITYDGEMNYAFGNGYLHMTDIHHYSYYDENGKRYDADGDLEYWYSTYAEDRIFAIVREGETVGRNMGADASFMNGFYFSGDFIAHAMNAYGVEDLVYKLYYLSSTEDGAGVNNFITYYDEKTGYYSFLFNFGEMQYGVYFTVDSDFVMQSVIVTGAQGYTDQTNADKPYYLAITQTKGNRTATNTAYDPEVLLINSFKIKDAQGKELKDGDTIEILAGYANRITLTLSDVLPTTASPVYDRIEAVSNQREVIGYVDNDAMTLTVNGQSEGTFDLVITTDHVSVTLKVKVTYPAPTEIHPLVYSSNGSYNILEDGATVNMFLGGSLNFRAEVDENADRRFTAALTGGDASSATLSDSSVEMFGETYKTIAFTPTKLGTYEVTVTSLANPELSTTFTITVTEMPPVETILTGDWVALFSNTLMFSAKFTPEAAGATKGTVVIVDKTHASGSTSSRMETVFAYEFLTDGIQLTYVSGDENNIKLSIDGNSNLVINNGGFSLTMTRK